MNKLEGIANQIREKFDVLTKLRDLALAESRQLTRSCSLAIRTTWQTNSELSSRIILVSITRTTPRMH